MAYFGYLGCVVAFYCVLVRLLLGSLCLCSCCGSLIDGLSVLV